MSTAGLNTPSEHSTATALAAAPADVQTLREQFSRTPRPYFHDGQEVLQDASIARQGPNDVPSTNGDLHNQNEPQKDQIKGSLAARPTRVARGISREGSESGSEADDERPHLIKALPPSAIRLRKGLKAGEKDEDALLTPSQLDDDGRPIPDYFQGQENAPKVTDQDNVAELETLRKRRLAEFLRRLSEVAFMAGIMITVLCGRGVLRIAWRWKLEILSHVLTVVILIVAYPIKLSIVDEHARPERLWQRFRVPVSFDPATVLYPPLLPLLVALSLAPMNSAVLLPNMILGLSSLPQRLFPRSSRLGGINTLHWLVSTIPLIVSLVLATPKSSHDLSQKLSVETLVSLYPLHHALLIPLHYLTTTSLLISELHLLSVSLINLLLLASSPQAVILKSCLWIGGVTFFVICGPLLNWNVTLARVPKWKLRRPGHTAEERRSLIDAVSELINLQRAASAFRSSDLVDSDADEDEPDLSMKHKSSRTVLPRLNTTSDVVFPTFNLYSLQPQSAISAKLNNSEFDQQSGAQPARPRRNTVPEGEARDLLDAKSGTRRKGRTSHTHWYLQLTADQALRRKWFYATVVYTAVVITILGPIREYIGRRALQQQEPIGWALGYLFGQLAPFRYLVETIGLEGWVPLPQPVTNWPNISLHFPLQVDYMRSVIGFTNVRLLIVLYWAVVLAIGLITVFSLTAYVEVDTRRKVFHGVMVAMLLPAIFVDPCYCALALSLVLAVFLLLEAIRAGQVPPLGSALSRFVAPYVDGRDLRGPVVVSHIFLLIGCAVPLWFSLASLPRSGQLPWVNWELAGETRETAMVAGVVCVGMGDAAASLIGRRYGRHKWLWVGGKSLEGSAAFAAAVTVGLMAAKAWLVVGGWSDNGRAVDDSTIGAMTFDWSVSLCKAVFCACGASFMEAVLTGANDNVAVPIALWLLVKGVRL